MRIPVHKMAGLSLGLLALTALPYTAWSYPSFQRLPSVSDGVPYCAGCHSITDAAYQSELPPDAAQAQVVANKHYKALEEGSGGYKTVEPEQRKQLLELAKQIDQNSSVKLDVPATVAPGGTVTVTVTTRGGIGPVNGVMLVDEASRFQARPIQGTGWFIAAPPEVVGSDGKPQSNWLDRRKNKQQANLNYILVYGVTSNVETKTYATSKVTYLLKAPQTPGEYPVTAAFLYGTADADEMKSGKYVEPVGGNGGPSGRIQFSNTVRIRVQ